ncbi:MAG: outer membrane beta-barrel protein [Crocinitomicaceae bacterium]
MKKLLYILAIITAFPLMGQIIEAETDPCLLNLNNADKSYKGGNIEAIPGLVKECLDQNNYSKENKTKAFKLLIDSYIFQGLNDSADIYMVKFLKFNPEFRTSEQTDRREFIDLHAAYRNYPVFGVGVKLGLGLGQLVVINEFGAHNIESSSLPSKYNVRMGFSAEVFASYHPHRDGEVFMDLGYVNYKFEEETRLFNYNYPIDQDPHSYYKYTETVNSLNLSIGYKYMFRKNVYSKVVPYLGIGIRGGLLLASNINAEKFIIGESQSTIKGSVLDIKHLRNRWNSWATAMIGMKFKIPKGNVFFEVGYDYNLMNISNPDERYNLSNEATNELLFKYFYVSNDFRLNNFYFKIGYNYNFYIPKKIGLKKKDKKGAREEKKKIKKMNSTVNE